MKELLKNEFLKDHGFSLFRECYMHSTKSPRERERLSKLVADIPKFEHFFSPDIPDQTLTLSGLGGGGMLICHHCRHSEKITTSMHGRNNYSKTGFQCQSCGKFEAVENSGALASPQCECSGQLRQDQPIFCPKCKSRKVRYELLWRT